MATFEIKELGDTVTRVSLAGRLDVLGLDDVNLRFSTVVTARRKPTVVDLSDVTFIGSMGIGMLVSALKSLRLYGAGMVLLRPAPLVAQTLEAAAIDRILPIVRNDDEVPRALGLA